MMTTTTTKLTQSIYYQTKHLDFAGFVDANGEPVSRPEYCYMDWFDEGLYIGPDEDGIEPTFETASVKIDIDATFEDDTHWEWDANITAYTAHIFGVDGDEPGTLEIVLQTAEMFGVTAWRWAEIDCQNEWENGRPTLSRAKAIAEGRMYAEEKRKEQ
jgi:hypothetical protein